MRNKKTFQKSLSVLFDEGLKPNNDWFFIVHSAIIQFIVPFPFIPCFYWIQFQQLKWAKILQQCWKYNRFVRYLIFQVSKTNSFKKHTFEKTVFLYNNLMSIQFVFCHCCCNTQDEWDVLRIIDFTLWEKILWLFRSDDINDLWWCFSHHLKNFQLLAWMWSGKQKG